MWTEKSTEYGFNLVENEGGKTLGYCPDSGVKIIEKDGFAFKDLAKTGELLPYEDWRLPAEVRADDLAKRLSIEQVAGLMCFSAHQFNIVKEVTDEQKTFLGQHLRSVLNSGGLGGIEDEVQIAWANNMQKYVEGMEFGIPCYFASDPRNGQGVSDWPGNLGLAATFDPELAKTAAKCQSRELRDLGVACFLAPQVDIASDPRWYRDSGTFGEDPALSRDMVKKFCDGLQSTYDENGNDLGWGKDSLTAMVKHWTGEGASEGGREAHMDGGKYAVYPNHNFEALMIPFVDGAFKLEGKTGSATAVMSSYTAAYEEDGSLGEPVGSSFSEYKIKKLLRERYGFTGVVCTDWMGLNEGKAEGKRACGWGAHIEDLNTTPGERAFIAIMAGVDQMGGCSNPTVLMDAYRFGCEKVGKEVMDEAFARSAQRLLQGYFLTSIGYVFMGVFLFLSSLFFTVGNLTERSSNILFLLRNMSYLWMLLCPILTMRLIAGERQQKTEPLLRSSPCSLTAIVVGKYLAACTLLLMTVVLSFIYPLIVALAGRLYLAETLVGYLGFVMMGFCFT